MFKNICKVAIAFVIATAMAMPALSNTVLYHYFRMSGGTTATMPPVAPLPAVTLSYVMTGPSAVGVGEPYAASPRVSGAIGAVTFSVRSGSLPKGTDLDPVTGYVSGTAALPGDYAALLVATDSTGAVGTATLSVSVVTGFAVSGSPVRSATVGGGYSANFSGVGGRAPYVFSTESALPPGLTLSTTGILSGVPTTAGGYPDLVVSARDADGKSASFVAFTLTVSDPLRLAWAPPAGTAGISYGSVPAVTGGQAPYSFALTGQIPGLTLSSSGILSGVPTTAGIWPLSLRVMDIDGRMASAGPYVIEIAPGSLPRGPLAVSSNPPAAAQVGVGYAAHFGAYGGAGGYAFSLNAGTLPDGLSLAADGTLSGTPVSAQTASGLQVKVTDGDGATALSGTFSIAVTVPPALQIAGNVPSAAMVGAFYTATLTGYNGSGAGYHFSLVSGVLPDGLTLSDANGADGVISGYPTQSGTLEDIVVRVTDSKGATADAGPFSIAVITHPPAPLALSGSVPSNIERDVAFSMAFTATGGAGAPYTFSVSSGTLPPGLSLTADGTLAGTPTAFGAYSFAVRLKDSAGTAAAANFTTIVPLPLALADPALGFAAVGRSYAANLVAAGGIPPYAFTSAGQLPPGLALNGATGAVSGVATSGVGGVFPLTLSVTDSKGHSASKAATLPVFDPLMATVSLPGGMFGHYFLATPQVDGGDGGYAFTLDSNGASALALYGLSFDPATGNISGSATRSGVVGPFVMTVRDGAGASASVLDGMGANALTITIAPNQDPALPHGADPGEASAPTGQPLAIAAAPVTEAFVGRAFAAQFSASGGTPFAGTPPYVFSLASGTLPNWMTLSSAGLLAGMPPAAGSFGPFAVKVTDAVGGVASSASFTVTVATLPPPNTLLLSGVPSAAAQGASYVFDLNTLTTGGRAPYAFSLLSGTLPDGMTLATDGIVSAGQVTGATATATIRVADADGLSRTAGVTFKVSPATAAITFAGGSAVRSGSQIFGVLTTSLSSPSWTLSQIPASSDLGLVLSGSGFSGVAPQTSAPLGVAVTATATVGAISAHSTSMLTVVPALSVSGGPQGVLAASIGVRSASPAVSVSGLLGAPSSAKISLLRAGSPFQIASYCPGLVFSATNGSISGTPSAACELSDLMIEVVDPADGSRVQTADFAVSATAPLAFSGVPEEAVQQSSYLFDLTTLSAGGSAPYVFSITSGSLPDGMVLASNGTISASAVTGSTTIATLMVTDAVGRHQSATLTFEVSDAYAAATLTSLSRVRAGEPVAGTLFATLPAPAWTFTQAPPSPSLNLGAAAGGTGFSGTAPYVSVNTDFVLTAVAKAGTVSRTSQPMAVTVMPALVLTGGPSGTMTASQGNAFGPTTAPNVVGLQQDASFALRKSGADFDLAAACPGLAFDATTGTISGTPTAVCATGPVSLRVTDSYDNHTADTPNFQITVDAATAAATLTSSAKLRAGDAITGTMTSSIAGATWSFSQTPVSPSLGLTAAGASVSGTAPVVSSLVSYSVVATAARSGVSVAAAPLSLQVAPALAVAGGPPLYVAGTAGNSLSTPPASLTGAVGAVSFTLIQNGAPYITLSTVCPGLTFSAASGGISGTPTAACQLDNLAVRGSDAFDGRTADAASFTLAVGAANASIALASSDIRSGAPIIGNLDTTLAGVTWTYAITPNSPTMTLTTSAGAARGTAPAVADPTTYTIVATATSGSVHADTEPVALTVWPALVVSGQTGTVSGLVGVGFVTAPPSAGTTAMGSLTWSLLKNGGLYANLGTDCPGLSFDTSTGVITGTPTAVCSIANLAVMATDVDYTQAATSSTFAVSINYGVASAAITSATTLHSGQPFAISGSVNAGSGLTAPSWSLTQVSPASPLVAYDKTDGARTTVFTGTTPDVAGSAVFKFSAVATDAGGSAAASPVSLTVTPKLTVGAGYPDLGKLVMTTNTSPGYNLGATNAIGVLTWSLLKDGNPYTALSTDCPGMSLSASTGSLNATNVQDCTVTGLQVAANDAADTAPAPALSKTFTISVAPAVDMSATLPTAQQGQPYDVDLMTLVTGGRAPFAFVVTSGSLPAGVALSGGHLTTGSDVVTGATSTASIKVTDADGRNNTFSKTLTVTPATSTIIMSGGQTQFRTGAAFTGTATTSITTPAWTISQSPTSPSLGLGIDSATGAFSGAAPAVASTTSFNLSVKATSGSFSVTPVVAIQVSPALTLSGGPTVVAGYVGTAIAAQTALTPNGLIGTASYSLTQDGAAYANIGSDCPGVTFVSSTGKFTGTPTALCSVTGLAISIQDSFDGATAVGQTFSVTVAAPPVLSGTLPNATAGQPYSFSLTDLTTGGVAPYNYIITSGGGLPTGLTMAANGTISGTVAANASSTSVTFRVADAGNKTSSATLALFVDGGTPTGVYSVGYNASGQRGNGNTTTSSTATKISGSDVFVTVSTGSAVSCGITSTGAAKCWGDNSVNQIGDGTTVNRLIPTQVSGLTSGVTAIAVANVYACAVQNGAAKCWGLNNLGQLGDNTTTTRSTPITPQGLTSGVTSIAVGQYHTCAIQNGAAKCWGLNTYGQVGDNSTTQRNTPVSVPGLTSGVTEVIASIESSCALQSGAVKCWGHNTWGQVGDNSTTQRNTPVSVFGLGSGVTDIASGAYHSCALQSGAVKCWGYNNAGQIGNGNTTQQIVPFTVTSVSNVTGLWVSNPFGGSSCVIISGGTAKCWGNNTYGQLGDGSTANRSTPVQVTSFPIPASKIASGDVMFVW